MTTTGERTGDLTPDQLRQINRLATIAQMVAGLAHEVNNSLQVMGGLVELVGDSADLTHETRTRIDKIGAHTEKAGAAIRQVLSYSRPYVTAPGRANLATVVEQAVALRGYPLGRANIVLRTVLPSPAVVVRGDERDVLQILLNLMLNAEDALAGQPRRELRVAVTGSQALGTIEVTDTGAGIDAAVRPRLFEPFFTTRQGERSLGLGLTVARQLAALTGGQLDLVESRPGHTAFVVELPVA